jgi:hypothetical protein
MRILVLAALVSFSLFCRAEAQLPLLPQAKDAFERYAPSSRFHDYATAFGDLNGDGITDFVTFVGDPYYNDNGVENLKAAVFLGAKDNTFNFYEVSSEILGHERVSHSLEINAQSIFLHRDGSGGCCSHWVEEFQFKMRDGRLTLIGIETSNYHPEGTTEPDTGMSANLLTGRVIKWTDSGKNRREKKMVAPALKPIPFKDFDYNIITEKWVGILW